MAESSVSDVAAVEEYLAKVPEPARSTLQTVRATLRALLPEATEGMSYGMPAVKLRKKPVAGYAAFVDHCGFYPMSGNVVAALKPELAGYQTTKGGVRFSLDTPLPPGLIQKLVNARLAELDTRPPSAARRTQPSTR
jgi:uncharacterized protein YdhG (YjbR/CyaY superfamily)